MTSSATAKKFATSSAGFSRLAKAWGHSVPASVKNTAAAMHGLERLKRRHS